MHSFSIFALIQLKLFCTILYGLDMLTCLVTDKLINTAKGKVENILEALTKWFKSSKLSLNTSKTNATVFSIVPRK